MRLREWLALALLLAFGAPARSADEGAPIPGDDFVVTGDVKIRPGTYRIADKNGDGVLHVRGDGTKLDLTGVTLIGAAEGTLPDAFAGVGVSVDGAKGVTVSGGAVRGFKIGVRVHDSPAAKLVGIDASGNFKQHLKSTVEREDESDWLYPHENDVPSDARRVVGTPPADNATGNPPSTDGGAHDDGHWERDYGAGIALARSPSAVVSGCTVRGGQNGVILDRCDKAFVRGGNFSFNSGWGVALWRTSRAWVLENRIDWCVRGYSHGRYARGQDSAGILVFEQCSHNLLTNNSVTHGGDGLFLYAGNETVKQTGTGGCNDNVVEWNDFSHAVANGIEATFSERNRLERNEIRDCEHGIWAGYSAETSSIHNEIVGCANGISIEHGHLNGIYCNVIRTCGVGIHLWWDRDADLLATPFGRHRDSRSHDNYIEGNEFSGNSTDVALENDQGTNLVDNQPAERLVVKRTGDPGKPDPVGPDHHYSEGESAARVELDKPTRLPADALRGRKYILVDDWGPVPPTETRLFPATVDAVGAAKLSALGVDKKFEVTSLTEGFVAEPMSGDLPATIAVRRKEGGAAPKPFEIVVNCGNDERRARGTVASMPWDVSFFRWTKDPREDAAAWKALLAGPPVETRRIDGLDYAWNAGAVSEKVGADRFGTLATCDLDLPAAGKWKLATVSDDGIRVWVDGKLVIDDWTHHGPTPHDADLDLAAGKHAIRVEHFEIDGWAVLRVALVPHGN